jgi:hypothetical protein
MYTLLNKNNKPTIEDVVISQEKLDELQEEIKFRLGHYKSKIIRRYCGGVCCICVDVIPTKKVSWSVSDHDGKGKLVEFYCNPCFERWVR